MKFKSIQHFLLCLCIPSLLHAQQTEIKYLSGTDKDHTVEWDFHIDRGMNSGQWTKIAVPSNWETQGFGIFNYGRGKQPYSNETGLYKYTFEVPAAWKNKVVNIVFEGSMTDTYVSINGAEAGPVHQGSFYRFKYDVSKLLKYGKENLLEVRVKNWSDNESVNKAERHADYWIFGGIYRPVYLEAHPQTFIDWTAVDAKANGDFLLDVYIQNNQSPLTVKAILNDEKGKKIGTTLETNVAKGAPKATLTSHFDNIKSWNPENPALYRMLVSIEDDKGNTHQIEDKIGFRTVELRKGDGIYVNNVKIMLKGANRHSAWPTSGRTTSKEISIIDVQLMKDMNFNAVRMSHYPPDKHFLEVCDSLGLFVLNELAGWQDAYDTEVGQKLVKEMVLRDVNRPSIIMWDNGNEGGNNHKLIDDYHLYDPQKRPVIHPWNIINNIDTYHYKDYNCCPGAMWHGREVFFPTEFLHGLYDGGHGAGLDDYWNFMRSNQLSAGGFLWVFADEGIVRVDKNGEIDTHGPDAPDGIVGPYREKEGSYFTIKEIWCPVHINKRFLPESFDGRLTVENRFHFTNLADCAFEMSILDFPKPNTGSIDPIIVSKKKVNAPQVAPDNKGVIELPLPDDFQSHDALWLKISDPHGRALYTYSWPIRSPILLNNVQQTGTSKVGISEGNGYIILKAEGVEVMFDLEKGLLKSVKSDGKNISLNGGPVLATGGVEFKEAIRGYVGNNYHIEFIYKSIGEGYEHANYNVVFTMLSNGILKMKASYLPAQGYYDYLGINFNYPEDQVTGMKFLGRGPYRVWKNRLKGTQFSLWHKDYNNTVTGESWDYPEFKGYHSELYWVTFENKEHPFTIYCQTPDIFLRAFTPLNPVGAYNKNTNMIFPEGDISFLHGIAPIGTKFKPPYNIGPQGNKNIVQYPGNPEDYEIRLIFDFR